jgi:hypothetical protein
MYGWFDSSSLHLERRSVMFEFVACMYLIDVNLPVKLRRNP